MDVESHNETASGRNTGYGIVMEYTQKDKDDNKEALSKLLQMIKNQEVLINDLSRHQQRQQNQINSLQSKLMNLIGKMR